MKTEPREIEIDEVQAPGARGKLGAGDDAFMAALARVMDNVFVIPGTNIRFGLDPIIGLIPGFGDTLGAAVSTMLLIQGGRMGVPKIVLARMALNVLINTAAGAIPVLGDAFSVYFKSNVRNLALLERHSSLNRRSTTLDWLFVVGLIAGLLGVVALSIAAVVIFANAVLETVRG